MTGSAPEQSFEMREVTVADPALSPTTNERLTRELREVVGATEVRVPVDRPRRTRGDARAEDPLSFATSNWLMAMIGLFAAIVVAGIIVTAETRDWWWIGLSMFLDIGGVFVIASVVMRMTSITERPDSTLVAALEAEGIANPEQFFTDLVNEFAASDTPDGEHRTTAVEDDHIAAAAEQKSAMTPTGGPSRAVGPGD